MKHVCSLENARRLQELGVTKEGYFIYAESESSGPFLTTVDESFPDIDVGITWIVAPAYTVGELGEMLPKDGWAMQGYFCKALRKPSHLDAEPWFVAKLIEALRNPNLCAEVLIWLIENGHVKVEDINGGGE